MLTNEFVESVVWCGYGDYYDCFFDESQGGMGCKQRMSALVGKGDEGCDDIGWIDPYQIFSFFMTEEGFNDGSKAIIKNCAQLTTSDAFHFRIGDVGCHEEEV